MIRTDSKIAFARANTSSPSSPLKRNKTLAKVGVEEVKELSSARQEEPVIELVVQSPIDQQRSKPMESSFIEPSFDGGSRVGHVR